MQRIGNHCTAVLGGMIFIGFCIQIVLGAVWMCNAFAGLGGFGEGIVCVGQFLLFVGTAFLFLRTVSGMGWGMAAFGSAALAMFPMILQCHMTVGRPSPAASLMMLETVCVLLALRKPEKKFWGLIALGIWFLLGFVGKEAVLSGAIPIFFLLLHKGIRQRKQILFWAALTVVTAGLLAGVCHRRYERYSLRETLASRFIWTNLFDTYMHLPEEWKALVNQSDVSFSSFEADGTEQILIPELRKTLEKQDVDRVLGQMMAVSWERHATGIMKEIVWDLAGYTVAPVVVPLQLQGRAYNSYSGINYRRMLQDSPKWGRVYMDYGCWWFQTAMGISVILWILKWKKGYRIRNLYEGLMILITCGGMAVAYTLTGTGKMDYQDTIFLLCVWLAWMWSAVMPVGGAQGGTPDEKI